MADRFSGGVDRWTAGLGLLRDRVRQELVSRQLAAHLDASGTSWALDVGCGQGTQVVELARQGHRVVGVDRSDELLYAARRSADAAGAPVRSRIGLVRGDLRHLPVGLGGGFDLVCCHGVAMYLPSLEETVMALVRCVRPGGLISILTRNRAGLAMRSGMRGEWDAAVRFFDARYYENQLGIGGVRADEPSEVEAALVACGVEPVAWYGVRLFTDHLPSVIAPDSIGSIVAAEAEAGRRDPYRQVAALTHSLARRPVAP